MAKVHPLHSGVGVNLILPAPCHAFQTQSVAFVCLWGSVRHNKQGNNSNPWGWWADLTAFLWLGVMTVKMEALEGGFDVFVLFRAGSGSPIHALMSWCCVWCWPSNLLWCSGPGVHPSILLFFFFFLTHKHTLYTPKVGSTNTSGYLFIYIASKKHVALLPCRTALMMKWVKMCTYACCSCLCEWRRGGVRIGDEAVCLHMQVLCWQDDTDGNSLNVNMMPWNFQIILVFSSVGLNSTHDFFSPTNSPSPPHKPPFLLRQPAWPSKCTIAFLCELSCFPVC